MESLPLFLGAQESFAASSSSLFRNQTSSPVLLPHSTSTAPSGKRFSCCTHRWQSELKSKRTRDGNGMQEVVSQVEVQTLSYHLDNAVRTFIHLAYTAAAMADFPMPRAPERKT
jgi:hypothetical protein